MNTREMNTITKDLIQFKILFQNIISIIIIIIYFKK